MFLRFVLIATALAFILCIFDFIKPKIIQKIRKYREHKKREKSKEAFRKKMEELEIK